MTTGGRTPRDNRIEAGYSVVGDGTEDSPAYVKFSLSTYGGDIDTFRAQLPETVTIVRHGLGFKIEGVVMGMSRQDVSRVFYTLAEQQNWRTKHHA